MHFQQPILLAYGQSTTQKDALKKISRVALNPKSTEVLNSPCHAAYFCPATIRSFEAISIRVSSLQLFLKVVCMNHHGNRLSCADF